VNLARVVGKVWATRKDPALEQASLLVIQPLDAAGRPDGERIAAADLTGSRQGQHVYFVSSKEAALPMPHKLTPVDACIVGVVDRVDRRSRPRCTARTRGCDACPCSPRPRPQIRSRPLLPRRAQVPMPVPLLADERPGDA